jgi:hypothetical protein
MISKKNKYVGWTEFMRKDAELEFWSFIDDSTADSFDKYWMKEAI